MYRNIYIIRVLFTTMALVILAFSDAACPGLTSGNHGWLFITGALYPHLSHLLLGRFNPRKLGGHVIFIADGLFVGALIAELGLAVVPSAVFAAINLFNWMIIGGPNLVAVGVIAMLGGAIMSGPHISEISQGIGGMAGCSAINDLASAVLIAYLLVVARVVNHHFEKLRQQQDAFQTEIDAATNARNLAERALLAVLPPSAARMLQEKGAVAPTTVDDATVLLIEFDWGRDVLPTMDKIIEAFHVCDMILARRGFESIKTFGRRILAMSRASGGPDDAIVVAREVENHLTDHNILADASGPHCMTRIAIHCGPVMLGMVQPERLNLELLGETIDALAALAAATANQPPGTVVASLEAQRKMCSTAGLVLASGDALTPPHYKLTLLPMQ